MILLIFPASVLLAFGSGFFCGIRHGQRSFGFRFCLLAIAYLFLAYASGFIAVCIDPYWIDNGVSEFIPLSKRWAWAFWGATVFEAVLCPILIGGYFLLRSRHNRNRPSVRDAEESRGWRIKREYYRDDTIAYSFEEYRDGKVWWKVCTVADESNGEPFSYTDTRTWPKIVIEHAHEIEADIGEPLPDSHKQPLE